MFCSNCGTQLPDDANFCLKCGKPQRAGVQIAEPQWETCEIHWGEEWCSNWWGGAKGCFWAEAVGPSGVYNAGRTETFHVPHGAYSPSGPLGKDSQTASMHRAMIAQLTKDGWESLGSKGPAWWSYRFRRRVK